MKKFYLFLSVLLGFSVVRSQNWQPLSGTPNGPDGEVLCLYHDTSCLWIGGHFTTVMNMSCGNVIRYNGTTYIPTPGFSGDCYKFIKYKNKIYACGNFMISGNRYGLIRFDTTAWVPILSVPSPGHVVYAAAVYHDKLILGGSFTSIGSLPNTKLVSYDGNSVTALLSLYDIQGPTITSSPIHSILVTGNELYVAGSFADGSVPVLPPYTSGVGKCLVYNGASWYTHPLNYNQNSVVYSLTTFQGKLCAAGYIDETLCCPYISSALDGCSGAAFCIPTNWNGWSQIGSGVPLQIRASTSFNGLLFVGGLSNGLDYLYNTCRLWMWNGATWIADPAFNQQGIPSLVTVNALEKSPDETKLYVGGRFSVNGAASLACLDMNTPLPVTLVSFSGKCENGVALLEWKTATEIDNDYFDIEYGVDGTTFTSIGRVDGHGTSSQISEYKYPSVEKSGYYRLAQVDRDGDRTIFQTVFVSECFSDDQIFNLNMAIVKDHFTVLHASDYVSFEIWSGAGILVQTVIAESSTQDVSILGLNGGVYCIVGTRKNGDRDVRRFVKI